VTFDDLPTEVRELVEALAKSGERHPDPEVAAAADEWAAETLSRGGSVGALLALALDFGLSVLLGGGGGGASGSLLAPRRLARRIRALPAA
jgi:hypothetical protein